MSERKKKIVLTEEEFRNAIMEGIERFRVKEIAGRLLKDYEKYQQDIKAINALGIKRW